MEDGDVDARVGVLVAAGEYVIVNDDVALVNVVAEELDDVLERGLGSEGDDGSELGLRQGAALGVEDDGHQVADLVKDR